MLLHPPGRQLAEISRRLFRQASQCADPDHSAEREEICPSPGLSRPSRPRRSNPRRCWWMAFCTSPFPTMSGRSMRVPATRSGITPIRRTKAITSGNRGVGMYKGYLFFLSPDAHLVSLNAKDGTVRWIVSVADATKGYWTTMAPLVVGDHVIVGVSGDFDNLTGYIRSIDPETGATQWQWNATPPPGTPTGTTGGHDVDDRNLRSRSQSPLLGNREPHSGSELVRHDRAMICIRAASSR